MRVIEFEGVQHEFPDETPDEVVAKVLKGYNATPSTLDVVKSIPGEAKRQLAEGVSGAVTLGADVGLLGDEHRQNAALARKAIAQERQEETPRNMNIFQEGLQSAGASILSQAPAMAVGALAAPVAAPAAIAGGVTTAMGAMTGLQKYGETRDEGFSPTRSGLHALFHGLVEKYTEYFPVKDLVGKPLQSAIYNFMWKEMAGEQAATLLQDLNDKLSTKPNMTLGDYLHDAAVTAIATGISGPVQAGMMRTTMAAMSPFIKPEMITPEQKQILDAATTAATSDGVQLPIMPPVAPVGSVTPPPQVQRVVDLQDQTLPDKLKPVEEGVQRVFGLIPSQGEVSEHTVWTSDLNKLQEVVDVKPDFRVAYIDMKPGELSAAQKGAAIQEFRTKNEVGHDEFILPTSMATNFIYNAPAAGSISGSASSLNSTTSSTLTAPVVKPSNLTVIHRNDDAKTKIRLTFADALSKNLFLYAKHVSEGAKTYAGTQQIAQEKAELVKSLGVDPSQVDAMAMHYRGQVVEVADGMRENGTVRPPAFSAEVYKQASELVASPERIRLSKLALSNTSTGEVMIASDVETTPHVRKMQAFLQKWLTLFAPGTKLMISSVAAGNSVAMLTHINGVSMMRVPSETVTKFWAIFSLAHEFGHHIFFTVQDRAEYAQAVAELKLEHQELVAKIPNMTVEELIDEWMAPNKMVYKNHVYETTGVKPTDPAMMLVNMIDGKKQMPGYMLSFDEYAAEQFARYIGKGRRVTLSGSVREWFEEAAKEVRAFFTQVVAKLSPQKNFEKFVDSLIAVPIGEEVYNEQKMNLLAEDSYFDSVDSAMDLTTRVLQRLPKKDKVQRITIVGELARPDVKDQERKMLQSVLDTFDGDVIDRQTFEQRVLEKIVPVTTENISKYATYGLSRIGVYARDEFQGSHGQEKAAIAWTELFRLPFDISKANHFSDPKYFGHSRFFDEKGVRSVVELQSDLAQKTKEELTKEGLDEKIKDTEDNVKYHQKRLDRARLAYTDPELFTAKEPVPDWYPERDKTDPTRGLLHGDELYHALHDVGKKRYTNLTWGSAYEQLHADGLIGWHKDYKSMVNYVDPAIQEEVMEQLENTVAKIEVNMAEASARLQNLIERRDANVPGRIDSLPKRWWEFMLRKMNQEASRDGVKVMRMASADTAAVVEGWPKQEEYQLPDLTGKKVLMSYGAGVGVLTGKVVGTDDQFWRAEYKTPTGKLETESITALKDAETHEHIFDGKTDDDLDAMVLAQTPTTSYGRAQGIYNRYANEITKFVKREFGAKEVDQNGQKLENIATSPVEAKERVTWLEWEVKPNLENIPVEYYDLIESMRNAADNVSNATQKIAGEDVPEVPKYFEKFTGFFLNSLQLNQLAKMLPHVQPLQMYRRLMQQLSNLKNTLMAGPNERIKQWYSLSKKDSLGVQDMLKAEVSEGAHWTKLEKHPIVVGGKQLEMWIHSASDRVATEAKNRGLSSEAVNLFLSIKNDFLTTLGTMEQTLLNSIEEHFRNNPIAGTARQSVARAQFEKFRQQPFLPDQRIGQWSVVIRSKNPQVIGGETIPAGKPIYFSGHQRRFQQKREFVRLKEQYGSEFLVTMEYVEDLPYIMRSLPREFIRSLPEQLQLSPDQMARFEELYYDVTKEGKYLKILGAGKKKIPGAPEDLRQAYSNYMWRTANFIAKMAFNAKLQRETYSLNRATNIAAKAGGDVTTLRRLHEYMVKNLDYVMRPQHEWEQLRAMVSLWYLWGVPKTALMNATTLVTTTYPRLAAIAGDAKATGHIIKAIKDVAQYWRDPSRISNEVAALFAHARSDGVTNQSFAAELAAVADGNAIERIMPSYAFMRDSGVKDRVRKYTWKMIHWGMLPFRVTEEFNRRVTLLASYRIERSLGKAGISDSVGDGSAYLAARDTVDYTQNEYAPWNRAVFLRGKKSVALIFFSFVQNMSFFMFGGDKGWWRSLLVIAALAGVEGLPGAENVIDFLNWLGRKTLGEPVDLRLEAREMATAIGVNPDYVMHGAMHSMFGLGWDVANSVGMGRIIPGTDAIFGQGDANQRILQMAGEIGGPFSSLSVALLQAMFDDNPNMLLRFDRALPPLVRNLERGYRGATDSQWTDSRGRALVDEATGLEVLGQIAGFSPTAKTSAQESLHMQKETAQFYVLRRTNLMSSLYQATVAKDYDAIADAKEAVREYNSKVPDPQLRITGQEMQQSLRARQRAAAEVLTGHASSKRYAPLYERVSDAFSERK